MLEKLKSLLLNDQIFYSFLILVVGVSSFGLGRSSVSSKTPENDSPSLSVMETTHMVQTDDSVSEETESLETEVKVGSVSSMKLVASKSGTKYHLTTCAGAKQIKDQNKITFNSIAEAEAAGYKPAANCPGLQ